MNTLNAGEIQKLLKIQSAPCASIFMPTHHASKEVRQGSIRLKNLLRQAEERLVARGMPAQEAQGMLSPGVALLDNSIFWEHQLEGLAFFFSKEGSRYFHLPLKVQDLVAVGDRFHLMPLLPMLTHGDRFYILALSQKNLRLYEASLHSIREVEMKNVPADMDSALKLDDSGKRRQYRVETGAGAAQRPGSVHGQGVGTDSTEHKKDIVRYFQMVDKALQEQVLGSDKPIMVLAGAGFLLPLYREANSYANLVDGGLAVHTSGMDMKQLHEKARELVEPIFRQREQAVINQYHRLVGTSRASERLEEILPAAHGGRVAVLLAPAGQQQWGKFDLQNDKVEVHPEYGPGDEDLLNLAAVQTLLHDGTVFVLRPEEMPAKRQAAAVFRY